MKHLVWAILIVGTACLPGVSAPLYRAGETSPAISSLLHGEISADYQFSSQKMKTERGDQTTSALKGWNARALWTPLPWLSVGAEMGQSADQELRAAFVSSYESRRIGGIIKLTLSPNTTPRVYLLAGYGKTSHRLNYDHSVNLIALSTWPGSEKKTVPYWMIGVGMEMNVWKALFLGIEGNLLRHQSAQLPRFYKVDSRIETALRVRVGVKF